MFLYNLCQNTLHKSSLDDNNNTYMHACIHSFCFHKSPLFPYSIAIFAKSFGKFPRTHCIATGAEILQQCAVFDLSIQCGLCLLLHYRLHITQKINNNTRCGFLHKLWWHNRHTIWNVGVFNSTQIQVEIYSRLSLCPPAHTRSPANCDCSNKVTITQRPN